MTNQRKARLVKKGAALQQTAQPVVEVTVSVDMRSEVRKKVEERESVSVKARATWRALFN